MMWKLAFLSLAYCFSCASGFVITTLESPLSENTPLPRRDDAAPIPTFTFGSSAKYFPTQISDPEPTGTRIQIYPTGTFDDFPKDGISLALGPELRTQIKDTIAQKCGDQPTQACRNALVSLFQNTDVAAHTKRFVVVGAFILSGILIAIAVESMISIGYFSTKLGNVPVEIKFDHADLAQIQSIGGASTFAAVANSATSTVIYQPPATSTSPDFITVETLSADEDTHKAGDVVYHVPQSAANRIQDFLGMTGLAETQQLCNGQNVKRADNLQECLRHIQRHAMDLADAGPSNLLQLAQQAIPARPGAGQAVAFPIQNLALDTVLVIIPVYHVVAYNAPQAPDTGNWDPAILAKSAVGLTIAAHAAMFIGQSLAEIWVDKDKLVTNLKEDDLACPKDILCVADDCKGQDDGKALVDVTPICKLAKNYGCKCFVVTYPHVFEVDKDYMDEQYKWLEELIKRANAPKFEPTCDHRVQTLDNAKQRLEDVITAACTAHPDLSATWEYVDSNSDWTFGITFQKGGGNCAFDCETIFPTFSESDSCITGVGLQKSGVIKADCGEASYVAYKRV